MASNPRTECWVAKVLLHPPQVRQMEMFATESEHRAVQQSIDAGGLYLLSDSSIAEPLELFDDEPSAHGHREKLKRDDPEGDYRVIVVTEVTV